MNLLISNLLHYRNGISERTARALFSNFVGGRRRSQLNSFRRFTTTSSLEHSSFMSKRVELQSSEYSGNFASSPETIQVGVAPQVSFYRRELPKNLVPFNSDEGKTIFKEALDEGYMESYFSLVGNFATQTEPAFCGLGSLAMVLNSLEMDPGRQWKGVWRWYSEDMLDCCAPLDIIKHRGITFGEFACLAQCNGLDVISRRANRTSKQEFLEAIRHACSREHEHIVVSYSRPALQQTGDGHFSPIGSYNEKRNLVLILDVARFKYPSCWVPFDMLWDSLLPIDESTSKPRGYFLLKRGQRRAFQFCRLMITEYSWSAMAHLFCRELPRSFLEKPPTTFEEITSRFFDRVSNQFFSLLAFQPSGLDRAGPGMHSEYLSDLNTLLGQIKSHPLYNIVETTLRAKLAESNPQTSEFHQKALVYAQSILQKIQLGLLLETRSSDTAHSDPTTTTDPIKKLIDSQYLRHLNSTEILSSMATIFMLASPKSTFATLLKPFVLDSNEFQHQFHGLFDVERMPDLLREEVVRIRDQLASLNEFCSCGEQRCGSSSSA